MLFHSIIAKDLLKIIYRFQIDGFNQSKQRMPFIAC